MYIICFSHFSQLNRTYLGSRQAGTSLEWPGWTWRSVHVGAREPWIAMDSHGWPWNLRNPGMI